MEIPKDFKFISYDGDGIGRKVGRAILDNDIDELRHISHLIEAGHALVQRWIKDRNGVWINGGGDEGNAAVRGEYIEQIEQLRKDYKYLVGATISVGVGKTPSEAGRALLIAKLKGKNRIEEFSKEMEEEIRRIKKRAKKGAFKSMEEHKLADAYLKKSELPAEEECEYCQQSEGTDPEHCQWCHDAEVQEGDEACPYCKEMIQDDPSMGAELPEVGEEDCAFCKEMDQEGKEECPYCNETNEANESSLLAPRIGTSPDSTNEIARAGSPEEKELYDRMDMSPPEIGKPLPPDERPPIGQDAPMDVVPQTDDQKMETPQPGGLEEPRLNIENAPGIDPEDNHSKEAMKMIAEQIENDGKPDTQEMNAVDDSAMPIGTSAEGNISRPDSFAQNVPGDMGVEGPNPPGEPQDHEEEPDFYGVLENGLDESAEGIKREKTIQIVSQALTQFKAAKMTLENIKMQAPDLYTASISMLKAMIEMAGLLGMGSGAMPPASPAQEELGSVQAAMTPEVPEAKQQEEQNDEWHDPFPTHPDQGGEAKPTHAP
jgi:hypothetical protein